MAKSGKNDKEPNKPIPVYRAYQVEKILRLRKLLCDVVGYEFLNTVPDHTSFPRLFELINETLGEDLDSKVLEDSLRHLAGIRIDEKLLASFCWRIAGNVRRLKRQQAVTPWHVQAFAEWVPVQIVSCRRQSNYGDGFGAMFGFRIIAGTSCSLTAYKWWSVKMCRFVSKSCGFTRPRGRNPAKFPYTQPEQLVGMRAYVLIEPELCDKEPAFSEITFPASVRTWNLDTLKCRFRVMPNFGCLAKRKITEPCHLCPIGFTRCRAATHRQDWVLKLCPKCGQETWFDPEILSNFCIACSAANVKGENK